MGWVGCFGCLAFRFGLRAILTGLDCDRFLYQLCSVVKFMVIAQRASFSRLQFLFSHSAFGLDAVAPLIQGPIR